ncbi:hypothetical protein J1605_000442 [Eschrichtius robustus]|uniref:Disks large-associated protein 5 n=1 Tax=Eschrichtius robustus TaxID=9764 RepID=A0AB34H9E5_ESCRO|nr:hypothetical protein J1605_000442 [Eschrichtius robustus]
MRRLSSCGSRAQLLHGMWDPPRPGLEPAVPSSVRITRSKAKDQMELTKIDNGSDVRTIRPGQRQASEKKVLDKEKKATQPVMPPVRMTRSATQAAKQIARTVPPTTARKPVTRATNAKDLIRTAVGQTRLLMRERFKQFEGLVDNCEYKRGEKETTCTDLDGFWDMLSFQIEDINQKFNNLTKLEESGWQNNNNTSKKVFRVSLWVSNIDSSTLKNFYFQAL